VKKRSSDVDESLPDTLQLLAGSLRAGYGLMQALDLAAREGEPPLSSEFGRALTEIRLGVPVEQALEDVADRIDNEDLRWVVMAVNIQRSVGGNLAALLETVSETVRSRQSFRRHLDALSADGRLSAIILSLLPVAAALLLLVVNPDYIRPLYTTGAGLGLVAVSLAFLGIGTFWIRRVIKIEI
jgi:tight adherence protein B